METRCVTIVELAVLVQLRSAKQEHSDALAEIRKLEDKLIEAKAVEQEKAALEQQLHKCEVQVKCLRMEVQGLQESQNKPYSNSSQVCSATRVQCSWLLLTTNLCKVC
jgi:hypothetical protein